MAELAQKDVIYAEDNPPTLTGPKGRAWLGKLLPTDPNNDPAVAYWVVEAPEADPNHNSYAVFLLRMGVRGKTEEVLLPGATHEVTVFALNPAEKRPLNAVGAVMHPANFSGQWIAKDDSDAMLHVQAMVQDFVDGKMNPETDIEAYIQRFSDSNIIKPEELEEMKKAFAGIKDLLMKALSEKAHGPKPKALTGHVAVSVGPQGPAAAFVIPDDGQSMDELQEVSTAIAQKFERALPTRKFDRRSLN
jgi:hypothetical protein